jgi:vacuolar-type H+-ATPase subunit H
MTEEENPGIVEKVKEATHVTGRVEQFIESEGERIRQETERVQSPIIAKAREEYKKRLTAFLEEEREKMKREAEQEAAAIRSKAESEAQAIVAHAQAEKQEIRTEAVKHAEQIIEEAKRVGNADRERVLAEGQKEATTTIEEAKQSAARLIGEAAELARKTTEAECDRILTEARAKANDQSQRIISDSWQRAQGMLDSAEAAYNQVRAQLQDCMKAILEADNKMEIVVTEGPGHEQSKSEPSDPNLELVA